MSRQRPEPRRDSAHRRGAAVRAALARPSSRQASRRDRERFLRRLILGSVGGVGLLAVLIVGFGLYQELLGFPNQPVAYAAGAQITLATFTQSLRDEMRRLQSSVGEQTRDETNPGAVGSQVQRLLSAQETLPEDILDREIEKALVREEAKRRGIIIPPAEIDAKINERFAIQRALLNAPTNTPTPTSTPLPTRTPTPEGFEPSPTPTRTPTPDPLTPTATRDPLTPTATREPFPTRLTATPVLTATLAPTLEPDEYERAYRDLLPLLRSEESYRRDIEFELLRERLRVAVGASAPTRGPLAQVLRLATSTRDEAKVALIQLLDFDFPFEEVVSQASERRPEGRESGDLGWVAMGAESPEFDQVVFSPDTPLGEWTPEPFQAGNHWEIVMVVERREGPYDVKNLEKIRDRAFKEWLDAAKQSPEVKRDLSPQERQWAIDRASKGIFEETTDRRSAPRRR